MFIKEFLQKIKEPKAETSLLTPEIGIHIEQIYMDMYESLENFPYGMCVEASKRLKDECNLKLVLGTFALDNVNGRTKHVAHAWNQDYDGTIIDLTASEFNIFLKNPFPEQPLIIGRLDRLARHYRRNSKLWEHVKEEKGL